MPSRLSSLLLFAFAAACTTTPEKTTAGLPPEPPRPAWTIPKGCEADLSGKWRHVADESFEYDAQDDGGTLSLSLTRRTPDGGAAPTPGDAGARIELTRSEGGFVGETRASALSRSGAVCPVAFPTRATACDDAGLTLETAMAASIDDACRPSEGSAGQPWTPHVLQRVEAPRGSVSDGGVDAG